MKKLLKVVLSSLLVLSLTACGDKPEVSVVKDAQEVYGVIH